MNLIREIDVKLIYGTETGFTKLVGDAILTNFNGKKSIINVEDAKPEDWSSDLLILGIPTWCEPRLDTFGEYSDDWNDSLDKFKHIDFTGQTVALYGLGDQVGYADNFVDGIGMLAEVVIRNGGHLIGKVSTDGYHWSKSNGLADENTFFGLPIDEDNEPTLTYPRIIKWIQQLRDEL
jgi:flavodoxin I|tara:strand:- start:2543 stop:3076 length:534 start_codon:yes stop_codon:yes gene_type:complete